MQISGWSFLAAALMLWLGWALLPVKLGTFFVPDDFVRIHPVLYRWIWLFRVHLFGYVVTMMALVALGSTIEGALARAVFWPAIAVAAAGLIVGALAQAFYYHFGAWGAIEMHGKDEQARQKLVDSLHVSTHYVTCLVRFGRVFFGLGLLVLAAGVYQSGLLPGWVGISAAALGFAAMALTMGLPDHLEFFQPVFHLIAAWLAATGVLLLFLSGT
jgi:hypothetical protein